MSFGVFLILLLVVAVVSFLLGYSFGCSKTLDRVIEMLSMMKRSHKKTENDYAEEKEE